MKVILYIATSLDGYIADRDGGVGWLDRYTDPADGDYGYADFYARVGAIATGRATYEQVRGFGDWPYPSKRTVVFSHGADADAPDSVTFTTAPPAEAVDSLRAEVDGDLWLLGGAALVASFRAADLIDEYVVTVLPVLLGEGIPLFAGAHGERALDLVDVESFVSGVVQLRYGRAA